MCKRMRICALCEEMTKGHCRAALFTILDTNKDNEIPLVE